MRAAFDWSQSHQAPNFNRADRCGNTTVLSIWKDFWSVRRKRCRTLRLTAFGENGPSAEHVTIITRLTRALMDLWISHHLMGGGVLRPPSNSAPRRLSEKRKKKMRWEARQKLLLKYFGYFFAKVNIEVTRHQRSSRVKFGKIPYFFRNVP